ncbi:hypothetical protein BIZ70_gp020 [Gordonia phage JSwag]|nr:hypothetical protein BIZ70_gp020 [Gordonia phage JSwag]AOE44503.1 hypothetical protein SEA_JSWAG_93 [Gordonia phage JSwag]
MRWEELSREEIAEYAGL